MNEPEDLISRLRALGHKPVDATLAGRHLAAMADGAGETPAAVGPRRHRLKIVAAFGVGLLVGTTGLATAGALPNGAQEAAHHALGAVGVNVPHGDRYQGPECGGTVKNHGQYVRSQPKGDRAQAAASRCGKPLQAGQEGSDDAGGGSARPAGGCQGPPPWAGKGKPDKAAKDARKQACGDDADQNDDGAKSPDPAGAGKPDGAPETPAAAAPETPTSVTTAPMTGTAPSTATTTTTGTTPSTTDTTATTATTVPAALGSHDATTTTASAGGTTSTLPAAGPVS